MSPRPFGRLADGREVRSLTLRRPGGLEVEVIEYGAVVRAVRVPTTSGVVEAVLGFDGVAGYEADKTYQGCVVGRCANRIDQGRFTLDGQMYQLVTNEGLNTLHGGKPGFDKRLWRFEAPVEDGAVRCSLTYDSPDGEEGFPGNVKVRAVFTLTERNALEVRYEAVTDKATLVNLSQHLYFNLSGDWRRPVLDHELRIAAPAITPVREDLIPTGEIMPVDGTPFDLRAPRRIGDCLSGSHPQLEIAGGFDHNWALDRAAGEVLSLRSPESGVTLTISTDEPGMQVYSSQGLGAPFIKHGAIVFEPQGFPDAVHHGNFPSVALRPGETYRHRSLYRFEAGPVG